MLLGRGWLVARVLGDRGECARQFGDARRFSPGLWWACDTYPLPGPSFSSEAGMLCSVPRRAVAVAVVVVWLITISSIEVPILPDAVTSSEGRARTPSGGRAAAASCGRAARRLGGGRRGGVAGGATLEALLDGLGGAAAAAAGAAVVAGGNRIDRRTVGRRGAEGRRTHVEARWSTPRVSGCARRCSRPSTPLAQLITRRIASMHM